MSGMRTVNTSQNKLFSLIKKYEGCSKSSDDLYLLAVSRDIFERHTMHHSKELYCTLIKMLISSRCTVSFNNYNILYIAHSIPLTCFHVIEL